MGPGREAGGSYPAPHSWWPAERHGNKKKKDVGLNFAYITPGFWVKVEGRSGLGFKHGISPHAGIIDSGYRSNAGIKLYNNTDTDYVIQSGDRIAQFVVYKNYNVSVGEGEVEESDRGACGFGSSGK